MYAYEYCKFVLVHELVIVQVPIEALYTLHVRYGALNPVLV